LAGGAPLAGAPLPPFTGCSGSSFFLILSLTSVAIALCSSVSYSPLASIY